MASIQGLAQLTHDAPAATWPFTAISTILFFMRTWSRFRLQKDSFGWDDLIITISWAIGISGAAFFQTAINKTHFVIEDPTKPTLVSPAAFWALFTTAWGYVTVALPKLVVGILICRLFRPQAWIRVSIIAYCVVLNVVSLLVLIFSFAQCSPAVGQWDPFNHPDVKCWDKNIQLGVSATACALSALTDIAFTVYPAFIIWKLQMPTWTKVGAISLMSLGLASFALAIVKLYALVQLSNAGKDGIYATLYWCIDMVMWARLESDFVISAACLPAAPPCFRAGKRMVAGAASRQPTYPTYGQQYARSIKSQPRSRLHKDADAVELHSKDETPQTTQSDEWGIKVGTEITTTYNYL